MREHIAPIFDPEANQSGYQSGLSYEEYAAKPGIRNSLLTNHTALEMLASLEPEQEPDDGLPPAPNYALSFGELFHKAVLEPHFIEGGEIDQYFQFAETKGIDTKKVREQLAAEPDLVVITPDMMEKAKRARDAIWRHDRIRFFMEMKKDGRLAYDTEQSGWVWEQTEDDMFGKPSGFWRQIRWDMLPWYKDANWSMDFKTMSEPKIHSAERMSYHARNYSYHCQAAYYCDTHELLTGQHIDTVLFPFIYGPFGPYADPKQPYIVRLFEMPNLKGADQGAVCDGRNIYQERLGIFMQAAHDDQWSAYEHEEEPIILT